MAASKHFYSPFNKYLCVTISITLIKLSFCKIHEIMLFSCSNADMHRQIFGWGSEERVAEKQKLFKLKKFEN